MKDKLSVKEYKRVLRSFLYCLLLGLNLKVFIVDLGDVGLWSYLPFALLVMALVDLGFSLKSALVERELD